MPHSGSSHTSKLRFAGGLNIPILNILWVQPIPTTISERHVNNTCLFLYSTETKSVQYKLHDCQPVVMLQVPSLIQNHITYIMTSTSTDFQSTIYIFPTQE